jgi:type VI secretion system protein ImpG
MNREFLDLYNRELLLFYEQAKEYAEEFPGIAERLGGLTQERTDPMVAGLLEGAAFLAARVQLKIKHEFPEFTGGLLELLLPGALDPTPSAMVAAVLPTYGDAALRDVKRIPAGSYMDAVYVERERKVSCRYRLSSDIEVLPFQLKKAEYYAAPGILQSLGIPIDGRVAAGLRLTLTHRTVPQEDAEPSDAEGLKDPMAQFAGCRAQSLPVQLLGPESDTVALLEQIFAQRGRIYFRYLDSFGDPVVVEHGEEDIEQTGFRHSERLFPEDTRVFDGFSLLREFHILPQKFCGFRLTRLKRTLDKLPAKTVDLVITFTEANPRLAAAVKPSMFCLYAAPAINLFEKITDRLQIRTGLHEYHVVPDRSHPLDFEPHRLLTVFAHRLGGTDEKVEVHPIHGAPIEQQSLRSPLYYTTRRLPRRRSSEERRYSKASDYTGTEMFLSITSPLALAGDDTTIELSVRALCSNRHLPEHLPAGRGGIDFILIDDTAISMAAVAGPTKPREPVMSQHRGRSETVSTGTAAWRVINMLALNHLGLVERGAGGDGRMLKETLFLFSDLSDGSSERRIRGIRGIESRPIVRRLQQKTGSGIARGIEVSVLLDEKAFEGSGVYLLGSILDHFFAQYTHINHFTQTVIRSTERGEVKRFPPRIGDRSVL